MPEIPAPTLLHCLKVKYMWSKCINVNINPFRRVHLNLISPKLKKKLLRILVKPFNIIIHGSFPKVRQTSKNDDKMMVNFKIT